MRCRSRGQLPQQDPLQVCGQLVGYITAAEIPTGDCTGGTATFLTETLPWHIQYRSFSGTLPAITRKRIHFVGWRVQINLGGITCLVGTTQSAPAVADINLSGAGEEREATTIQLLPEFTIPLGGGFACTLAGNGRVSGTGEVFTLVTPQTRIKVRLVQ